MRRSFVAAQSERLNGQRGAESADRIHLSFSRFSFFQNIHILTAAGLRQQGLQPPQTLTCPTNSSFTFLNILRTLNFCTLLSGSLFYP